MRLVGKEILHPLKGRRNQNPEKPRNLPMLKFLLNQKNQAESGLKLRSLTPHPVLSPSFPPFLSSFFTKCVSSFYHVLFPFFSFYLFWLRCHVCVCLHICACVCSVYVCVHIPVCPHSCVQCWVPLMEDDPLPCVSSPYLPVSLAQEVSIPLSRTYYK